MRIPSVIERSPVGINMTPLIDVVFQLLIFFLVSSHLAKQEAQMPLELPEAASGYESEMETDRERVTLNVLGDGALVLAGRRVDVAELPERLSQLVSQAGREVELRVRGDRSVQYSTVEPVLLACARAGLRRVTFAVYRTERP